MINANRPLMVGVVRELMKRKSDPLYAAICALNCLKDVHLTGHWSCAGQTFYTDHTLFQTLYQAVVSEVDDVAEKFIGTNDNEHITHEDLCVGTALVSANINTISKKDFISCSLEAELNVMEVLNIVSESLTANNGLTKGIDNMICDMLDAHEKHVYLLKQRLK